MVTSLIGKSCSSSLCRHTGTVILQIFGVVLFRFFRWPMVLPNKKTPKCEKHIEQS